MKLIAKFALFATLFSVLFCACKKENEGWDVDALVPLVQSKLDLQNIFEDSLIRSDDNQLLKLVYHSDFINLNLDEDFKIPDTTTYSSYKYNGFPAKWDKRAPLDSSSNSSSMAIKNVNLTYVRIKSGKIKFKVTSSISEPVRARYVMPIANKNGDTLRYQEIIPAAGGPANPIIVESEIDISDYLLDLRGPQRNDYNIIQFYFVLEFNDKFHPDTTYTFNIGDYVTLENSFVDVVPEYGKGVFLNQIIHSDESNDEGFDAFSQFLSGTMDLEQAKLAFTFDNYVGADLKNHLNKLVSVNERTGNSVSLTGDIIGQSFNIGRAKEDYSLAHPHIIPTRNAFELNEENSNIVSLIENQPNAFEYEVDFEINPLGNISGGNDFLRNGYGIKAGIDIEIPLCIKANELVLFDTTDFAPGTKDEELNSIMGGALKIYCDNSYPLSAKIKIDLYDDHLNFLMTLLEPRSEISAGIPESDGIVRKKVRTALIAPISPSALDQFYNAKKAVVYLTFNTPGNESVKLYSFYNTEVKVVADVQYNVVIK